ncbi:Ribonuclease G [hydrothermal vent metagenome]|uniref:Ribonuclease G n=1 Tax=hydrothermal vent metagenome TaxID=652676 RepID=A0A3B0Z6N2_9ZZZZ
MSDEILVNVTPQETRVAVVENGLLQEIYIERSCKRGLVGNIYHGKVSRVLPGMQAAFIDIGLDRTAFLHVSDIQLPERLALDDENASAKPDVPIESLLRDGQKVMVQVFKDPLGSKGARLTMQISIPSRYLVFMPSMTHLGISQKIEDEDERLRLRTILESGVDDEGGGFIARTAAEGAEEGEILEDMAFLRKLWASVKQPEQSAKPNSVAVLYEDLPLVLRMLRDFPAAQIDKIRIDSREAYQRALEFVTQLIPELAPRTEHYPGERPIFDLYSVEDEIQKALERTVQLKSGGHLCIDQTEAMTTVDVNTGAFVGHRNLEETIFKTNLEAAQAIARQLKLRNLGGIIIIDFIDMMEEDHKKQVLHALERGLGSDRAKSFICDVSPLGLVEMTRKRTRESLGHILCEPCSVCGGTASVKTRETVCYEIFRELMREARQFDATRFLVLASQEVVDVLLDEESTSVAELEEFIGKPIQLQVETLYTQEQFDVVLM